MNTSHMNFQNWNPHELSGRLRAWTAHARSLLAARPTLLPGTLCYAAIFGLVIYNLAVHARLDSWRQPEPAAESMHPAAAIFPATESCAQFAGMGQRLCSAEAKFNSTRARLQERVETRKVRVRTSLGLKPAERVKSAPAPSEQVTPVYLAEQPETARPNLAAARD